MPRSNAKRATLLTPNSPLPPLQRVPECGITHSKAQITPTGVVRWSGRGPSADSATGAGPIGRLRALNVEFTQKRPDGPATNAAFDATCGNPIEIAQAR